MLHRASKRAGSRHCAGFTLVEMITVVAIMAMLVGLLFPVLRGAMDKGKEARTLAVIGKLDGALYLYQSDFRDFPECAAVGGSAFDSANVYSDTAGLRSEVEINGPYIQLNDKEVRNNTPVDGWGYPITYCHFLQYDATWNANAPWRFEKKKFEFQLVSFGSMSESLDANKDGFVSNGESSGKINAKNLPKVITNW